jgi:hypothetical protein
MINEKLKLAKKRFLNFLLNCDNEISSEQFEIEQLKLCVAQLEELKQQKINELETLKKLNNNEQK